MRQATVKKLRKVFRSVEKEADQIKKNWRLFKKAYKQHG